MKKENLTTIRTIVKRKGRRDQQRTYPLTMEETIQELKAEDYNEALSDVPVEEQDKLIQEWAEFAARPRIVFNVSKGADEKKVAEIAVPVPVENKIVVRPLTKSAPKWHLR